MHACFNVWLGACPHPSFDPRKASTVTFSPFFECCVTLCGVDLLLSLIFYEVEAVKWSTTVPSGSSKPGKTYHFSRVFLNIVGFSYRSESHMRLCILAYILIEPFSSCMAYYFVIGCLHLTTSFWVNRWTLESELQNVDLQH